MTLFDFLPYIGAVIASGITLGMLFFAARWGYSKQAGAMQEKTLDAQKGRIESLEAQAELDQKELTRLREEKQATRHVLKRRGLRIEIVDDFITLIDRRAKRSYTMSMQRALHVEDTTNDEEEEDPAS